MELRLLEDVFMCQKLNLFIFTHALKQKSPLGRRKLPILPEQPFLKNFFSPSRKGEDYGAERMTEKN